MGIPYDLVFVVLIAIAVAWIGDSWENAIHSRRAKAEQERLAARERQGLKTAKDQQ